VSKRFPIFATTVFAKNSFQRFLAFVGKRYLFLSAMGESIFRHEFENGDELTVFSDGTIDVKIIGLNHKCHTAYLSEKFNLNELVKLRQKHFFHTKNIESMKYHLDENHPCPENWESLT